MRPKLGAVYGEDFLALIAYLDVDGNLAPTYGPISIALTSTSKATVDAARDYIPIQTLEYPRRHATLSNGSAIGHDQSRSRHARDRASMV